MEKKTILIAGYGNIGKYLYKELGKLNPVIYDKYIPEYSETINARYHAAFVCVPTEMLPDGSADISIVEEVVSQVSADVICIKSAVPVGTTDMLAEKYGKYIVISPEYYGTTQHSPDSPDFLVLGGDVKHTREIAQLYYKVKRASFRVRFTDAKTAELAKYMENCFLALKVTFCSEFKQIGDKFGVPYEDLREIFIMDERMGESHTFVYEDTPFYDSYCLNKDVSALISFARDVPLIKAMHEINMKKKTERPNK